MEFSSAVMCISWPDRWRLGQRISLPSPMWWPTSSHWIGGFLHLNLWASLCGRQPAEMAGSACSKEIPRQIFYISMVIKNASDWWWSPMRRQREECCECGWELAKGWRAFWWEFFGGVDDTGNHQRLRRTINLRKCSFFRSYVIV